MGQYFIPVNQDKREWFDPNRVGSGLKFWEVIANKTVPVCLAYLLGQSSDGLGLPTWRAENRLAGSWAGDRITVIGDYDSSGLYESARKSYRNISEPLRVGVVAFLGNSLADHFGPWEFGPTNHDSKAIPEGIPDRLRTQMQGPAGVAFDAMCAQGAEVRHVALGETRVELIVPREVFEEIVPGTWHRVGEADAGLSVVAAWSAEDAQ